MNKIKTNMLLLLSISLILTGCFDSANEAPTNKKAGELQDQPYVIKPEIYGDSDIFYSPRIQFSMRAPDESRQTIWSIKTDGSDLRQAVDYDLLYGDGSGGYIHPPVRSPDNRYIVLSVARGVTSLEKQLIDLKTKTKITFAKGGGIPLFQWSADSKEVFFHMDHNLWRYHVDNKTMTKEVKVGYQGTYYLKGKDQFFVVQEDGFELFNRLGESVRKVVLNTKWGLREWHQLSASGSLFSYDQRRALGSFLIDTENPEQIILKTSHHISRGIFSEKEDLIYFFLNGITSLNVSSGKEEQVFYPPTGFRLRSRMTLINL